MGEDTGLDVKLFVISPPRVILLGDVRNFSTHDRVELYNPRVPGAGSGGVFNIRGPGGVRVGVPK